MRTEEAEPLVAPTAEDACRYVASRVRLRAGARWLQAPRRAPIAPIARAKPSPFIALVAERHLAFVSELAARALLGWAGGERPVVGLRVTPTPRALLAMQARGERCVTLLGELEATARDDAGLEFALHDLCHLEKFVDVEHHRGQRGFFASVDRAIEGRTWSAFDLRFDEAWKRDVEHVVADMNGSAIFLFAALKMKLRMASRRRLARELSAPPPRGGVLDAREAKVFDDDLAELLEALDLRGAIADDARGVSTRRDSKEAAQRLLAHFEGCA